MNDVPTDYLLLAGHWFDRRAAVPSALGPICEQVNPAKGCAVLPGVRVLAAWDGSFDGKRLRGPSALLHIENPHAAVIIGNFLTQYETWLDLRVNWWISPVSGKAAFALANARGRGELDPSGLERLWWLEAAPPHDLDLDQAEWLAHAREDCDVRLGAAFIEWIRSGLEEELPRRGYSPRVGAPSGT